MASKRLIFALPKTMRAWAEAAAQIQGITLSKYVRSSMTLFSDHVLSKEAGFQREFQEPPQGPRKRRESQARDDSMTQYSIRLHSDVRSELKDIAGSKGVPVSDLIRDILLDFCQQEQNRLKTERRRRLDGQTSGAQGPGEGAGE